MARLRRGPTLREYRALRRIGRRLGYDLVRANYYSPIPALDAIPPTVWTEPDPMLGLEWDLDAQLGFLREQLGPFLSELDAPTHEPGDAAGFHLRNPYFHALDAEVLHAIVRTQRPRRVVELGSGFSTLLIAGAGARNAEQGAPVEHLVFDPNPSPVIERLRARVRLSAVSAREVPDAIFEDLGERDLLFIDTTHTVKPGGEVTRLILDVMPRLASGVLVHVHDFFRPFEYPRVLFEHFGVYWQEHHLVQAFLAYNDRFEILCACHALARLRTAAVRALVPSLEADTQPSSLWLRCN